MRVRVRVMVRIRVSVSVGAWVRISIGVSVRDGVVRGVVLPVHGPVPRVLGLGLG